MNYYIHNGESQIGPFNITELKNLNILPTTPIWKEDLIDWTTASELKELNFLFETTSSSNDETPTTSSENKNEPKKVNTKNLPNEKAKAPRIILVPKEKIKGPRITVAPKENVNINLEKKSSKSGIWITIVIAIVLIGIVSIVNLQKSNSWSEIEKTAFMTECVYNVDEPSIDPEEYCSCMLNKVMDKYPTPEEVDLYMTDEWIMTEAMDCLPY